MKSLEQDFDNSDRLISYQTTIARSPVLFQPFESQHLILHRHNLILFEHHLRSFDSRNERSFLTLECLSCSLSPIQLLLEDAQTYSIEKTASTTGVFRAEGSWYKTMSRPYRDTDAVILEKSKKQALLRDINESLHPRTRKWYSNHRIPIPARLPLLRPPRGGQDQLDSSPGWGFRIGHICTLKLALVRPHSSAFSVPCPLDV